MLGTLYGLSGYVALHSNGKANKRVFFFFPIISIVYFEDTCSMSFSSAVHTRLGHKSLVVLAQNGKIPGSFDTILHSTPWQKSWLDYIILLFVSFEPKAFQNLARNLVQRCHSCIPESVCKMDTRMQFLCFF